MLALVMSGAANFGAMQAGAVEVLLAAGLEPKMIVGTSAGALNAVSLAGDPTPDGVRELQAGWKAVGPKEIGMPSALTSIRRYLTNQDGLIPSEGLARFVSKRLPATAQTFGELRALRGIEAYTVAVCMENAEVVAFGDRDEDRLLDGIMSSTALPPYLPPWRVNGMRYIDGGVSSKLPVLSAINRGATQVVALDVSTAAGALEAARGIRGVSLYALALMVEGQTAAELNLARATGAPVRIIRLPAPPDIPVWDYTQSERLIELGRETAERALEREPLKLRAGWWLRARRRISETARRLQEL